MIRHIQFCLEEIEAEIDAQDVAGISTDGQQSLRQHIVAMRAVLAGWRPQAASAATEPEIPGADDLTLICGIDAEIAAHLRAKGVTRFQTIADWLAADIAAASHATLAAQRISQENWIEQAAILATGALTYHARRVQRGEFACLARDTGADTTTIDAVSIVPVTPAAADASQETPIAPHIAAAAPAATNVPMAQENGTSTRQASTDVAAETTLMALPQNVVSFTPAGTRTSRRLRTRVAASLLLMATAIAIAHVGNAPTFASAPSQLENISHAE
ncbi:MAG: hypothetical protein ACKVP7_19215 [Hyphomicrobiaceae bacterium]